MAGGIALPPASAATQGNDTQTDTQWDATPEEIDKFLRENEVNFELDPALAAGWDLGNVANENAFPPNFTADDAFKPVSQDATPMQPQFPMPAPMTAPMTAPMPTQTPTSAMPDMSLGPSYDPRIGWYYPAPTPAPASYPRPPMPFAMPQEGYTPASSAAPDISAMPSRTTTPVPGMPGRTRERKRKYGPAAYLDEQAKNASAVHPRAVSISQAEYTSQAKRRNDRVNGNSDTKFARKRTTPSIVQVCICSDKETKKIKRPRNAFILYRSTRAPEIMRAAGNRNNQNVSTEAAKMWKNETPTVKRQYEAMAEEEKRRHKEMYPDYTYQPGLTNRNKFGSASCKCGAYRANLAVMRAKQEAVSSWDAANDSEPEELDEYLPPRGYRAAQPPAPPAPMTYAPLPDPSIFGLTTDTQRAQAQEFFNAETRRRKAVNTYPDPDTEPPIAKRLRSRAGISYTDPSDMELDDEFFPVEQSTAPRAKRRPSPITSGPPNMFTFPQDNSAFFNNNSPPALNTRARSRSRTSHDNGDFGVDFNDLGGGVNYNNLGVDFDIDEFMNGDLFTNTAVQDSDGDNIIVASRSRRSSSKKSPTKSRPGSRGSLGGAKTSPTLRRSPRNSQPGARG